jgi:hypothetical protein
MQKLIVLLSLLTLAVGVANAESEIKIENGELLVSPSRWNAIGVKVTPEAQRYPLSVKEAFNNPGKLVIAQTESSGAVVDLFHFRLDLINKSGVRYDAQRAVVDVVAVNEEARTEVIFSPLAIFWMISIVAFFTFTIKGNTASMLTAFFAASAIAAFSGVAALFGVGFPIAVLVSATFAIVAALSVLLISSCKEKLKQKRFSTAFYVMMILSAGITYYPLF